MAASSSNKQKGNRVELGTFKSWGKEGIIGYKTEESNSKIYVNFIWCKVCAKYKSQIVSAVKGSAQAAALSFINGTNFVSKHTVK